MPELIAIPYTLVEDQRRDSGTITRLPFTVGRLPENDVVLTHPYVSRRHAEIVREGNTYYIVDIGSRHGTYWNGQRISGRKALHTGDTLAFGTLDGPVLQFGVSDATSTSTIREIIEQLPSVGSSSTALEKLRWFFEAARKLTGDGGIEQILAALLETTLQLTQVERGYVFLRDPENDQEQEWKLAMGRDSSGEQLFSDATVSHGAIREALKTAKEFIVTDTLSAEQQTESIVAQHIRSVICIPLRSLRRNVQNSETEILGLLYLDSRLKPGVLSKVDSDLLRAIATDAAALIENTQLALAEERARHYRDELNIAARIQTNIMNARLPSLPFATVAARSVPCREIGGDFFLAVGTDTSLSVAVADIAGKGISAAILACTMQGMIYAQLISGQPLDTIAAAVNRYICEKDIGRYATMSILRLHSNGRLEYINCGHIPPFLCSGSSASRLAEANLPVGMIENTQFHAEQTHLPSGSRILIVTDGVTEAHSGDGDFFGEDRVARAALGCSGLDEIFAEVEQHCRSKENDDDCTILEVHFTG
jgi:sigma-B regulation protein RsbU (phosphoserine phosphatase)